TEPPPSVPIDQAPRPSRTAAADPPLDPPAVSAGSHGLPVAPHAGESVTPFQPNSGVVVLPSSTAPASRSRATAGASSGHGPAAPISELPRRVGHPAVRKMSLIEVGMPSAGPSGAPATHRRAGCWAAARGPCGPARAQGLILPRDRAIAGDAGR